MLIYLLDHSHSFAYLLFYSLSCLPICLLSCLFACLLTASLLTCLIIYLLAQSHSFAYLSSYSLSCSPICLLSCLLVFLLTVLLTYLLTVLQDSKLIGEACLLACILTASWLTCLLNFICLLTLFANFFACLLACLLVLLQSAAALCVAVGSFCEPDELPGLAHYVEHSRPKFQSIFIKLY